MLLSKNQLTRAVILYRKVIYVDTHTSEHNTSPKLSIGAGQEINITKQN